MSPNSRLNLITATAGDLRPLLEAGEFTSVELVELYLAQIAAHNHAGMKLNAIITTAPTDRVLDEARALDEERRMTGPRSRLHGIPVILKVGSERSGYLR
jgi:amidase